MDSRTAMGARPRVTVAVVAATAVILLLASAWPAVGQTTTSKPPLSMVVLGDSYSAGNGARDAAGNRAYWGPKGCYRSEYSWSGKYKQILEASFNPTLTRVACSGGVLADFTAHRDMHDLVTVPRFLGCPAAKWDEEWRRINVTPLEAECRRFLKPQIDAVSDSTNLVTFTAGGNDAKFDKIVEQCFAVGLRDPGGCRSGIAFADDVIDTKFGSRLDTVFGRLRGRLRSNAQVLYVGYPYLVDDVGYRLKSTNPFNPDDYAAGDEVRRIGDKGDVVQRAAVARSNAVDAHKFTFVDGVDIKGLFARREPNPDQSAPRNPNRWFHEFETRLVPEWYHFNPSGHQGLANFLASRYSPSVSGGTRRNDVDMVFAVDTTGSMGGVIASVRNNLTSIVDNLAVSTNSFRVGVVSYRDFPERTGSSIDYPARVDTPLTSDRNAIAAAIGTLQANGGGDFPESVFSGMEAGLNLSWRPGVAKVLVVIGDAPPLGPPEPITGLTAQRIIRHALEIDPVQVFAADAGALATAAVQEITTATGGRAVRSGDIVATLRSVISTVATQPFGWLAGPYSGATGTPVVFDATGSFDPSGSPLTGYEWDINGDGTFDGSTSTPTFSWTFGSPFSGVAVVRVTGVGGTALGSAWIDMTATGSTSMGDETECAIGLEGKPAVSDADGRAMPCHTVLPPDPPDIIVTSTGSLPTYTVHVVSPTPRRTNAGSTVQIRFVLTDATGAVISDELATSLVGDDCDVLVSITGVQSFGPSCPTYDPTDDTFKFKWKSVQEPTGTVTVKVAIRVNGVVVTTDARLLELVRH